MGNERENRQKIIIIVGQTASGKSDLAVYLSKKISGEVISADSRQVYKKMDIGSGKITQEEMQGVPHHLLDVASPKRKFSAARYKKLATQKIRQISKRGNTPVICGGTAFYIDTLVGKKSPSTPPPNWELRERLEKQTAESLFSQLKEEDPRRAKEIDPYNKRRLVRALEIIILTGQPVPKEKKESLYDTLWLGIKVEQEKLNKKINLRLRNRVESGMIEEVLSLKKSGLSWKRLESFGLEYKWVSLYLQEKIDYEEMLNSLSTDIKKFSKRQKTWWKNNKQINWITTKKEALFLAESFLSSSQQKTKF